MWNYCQTFKIHIWLLTWAMALIFLSWCFSSNECCAQVPCLISSPRVFLATHHPDVVTASCPSAPEPVTALRANSYSTHSLISGRKGGVFLFRVKGSDRPGVMAVLVVVWISAWLICFQLQLLTWAYRKLSGRSQHLVSLWWNKNCLECKIRLLSPVNLGSTYII